VRTADSGPAAAASRRSAAVADHQAPAILTPLGSELGYIGIDLGLQRLGQHPPGVFPDDFMISDDEPSAAPGWPGQSSGATVGIGLYIPDRLCTADLA
jgi:hypothetical protein